MFPERGFPHRYFAKRYFPRVALPGTTFFSAAARVAGTGGGLALAGDGARVGLSADGFLTEADGGAAITIGGEPPSTGGDG